MPTFHHEGIAFHYRDEGDGLPFVFQHGLGGDVDQPFGFFMDTPAASWPFRLVALDCRAHGETRPLGPEGRIGIASFADDVAALLDHLDIEWAVVGGISMGAAVALNFVLRFPERVRGLVLSRPAWLDAPLPENLEVLTRVAALIREHGAVDGKRAFLASDDYLTLLQASPDVASSLLGQFDHPRAEEAVARLERIPRDAPCANREAWSEIGVPVLVLANRQDPIHPISMGETLASAIPGAEFHEVTPKSTSATDHHREVRHIILAFIQRLSPA